MTRLEAATNDYLRFMDLQAQLRCLTDDDLGEKFGCSDRSIRKIVAGHTISTLDEEDHRLIRALDAERKAMRAEAKGKNLQDCCARHHIGKSTLINRLVELGVWEEVA